MFKCLLLDALSEFRYFKVPYFTLEYSFHPLGPLLSHLSTPFKSLPPLSLLFTITTPPPPPHPKDQSLAIPLSFISISQPTTTLVIPSNTLSTFTKPANKQTMSQNLQTIDLQPQSEKPMGAQLRDSSSQEIISEQPVCEATLTPSPTSWCHG